MGKLRTIFHHLTFGIVDSNEEVRRKATPCKFDEYLSYEDFKKLAIDCAKPIKRLFVSVEKNFVYCNVRTLSGINSWEFTLDFNDFGKVTGRYWSYSDNSDSNIPSTYAGCLSSAINDFRNKNRNSEKHVYEGYFCPNCGADLSIQKGFDASYDSFTCKSCQEKVFNPNIYSGDKFGDVYWYCDRCNALLNKQKGFNDSCGFWHCSECGYKNEISEDNIE